MFQGPSTVTVKHFCNTWSKPICLRPFPFSYHYMLLSKVRLQPPYSLPQLLLKGVPKAIFWTPPTLFVIIGDKNPCDSLLCITQGWLETSQKLYYPNTKKIGHCINKLNYLSYLNDIPFSQLDMYRDIAPTESNAQMHPQLGWHVADSKSVRNKNCT